MPKNLQLTKNNQHGIIYTEKITGKVGFMSHYNNQRKQNRTTYQKPVNLLYGYEAESCHISFLYYVFSVSWEK